MPRPFLPTSCDSSIDDWWRLQSIKVLHNVHHTPAPYFLSEPNIFINAANLYDSPGEEDQVSDPYKRKSEPLFWAILIVTLLDGTRKDKSFSSELQQAFS